MRTLSEITRHKTPTELVHELLSPREMQVWTAIAQGDSPARIAKSIGISTKTYSTYRENLKVKLEARGTADLVRLAVQYKIIKVEIAA